MSNIAHTEPNLRPLVIIGADGHAVSVANVALSAGYRIVHFVHDEKKGGDLFGISIIGDISEIKDYLAYDFAIAVGHNAVREFYYNEIIARHANLHFPSLIHSSAVICSFTTIEKGTVVMPNAVVGPNSKVGKFCIVNTRASLGHDCLMHDFSSLASAATTGGTVSIGERSAISLGAVVRQKIDIGDDCVIGANSYINKDVPSKKVAYGTPAKQVRERKVFDPYL